MHVRKYTNLWHYFFTISNDDNKENNNISR